jgi:Transglycosylase
MVHVHRIWQRLWLVAAGLGLLLVVVAATAWYTSPAGTGLGLRVESRLRAVGGRVVRLNEVSPVLRDAVVATEDERFYRHHGIDLIGLLRAVPYDLAHVSFAQGASTITEQVAKLFYLNGNDHSPWRKLEDAAVAFKLEDRYTKQQILSAYLNGVYFGNGAYGVRAASERYFGTTSHSLNAAQATLLAGLIQAPSAYDPLTDPVAARARQIEVLRAMVNDDYLTMAEALAVLRHPLPLRGGVALPAIRGISLAAGPPFIWMQFALGAVLALAGATAFATIRLKRLDGSRGTVALKVAATVLCVIGAAIVVRSFRSA